MAGFILFFSLNFIIIFSISNLTAQDVNYSSKLNSNFFIENKGQWDSEVLYLAKIGGTNSWITKSGIVYDHYQKIRDITSKTQSTPWSHPGHEFERETTIKGHVVKMTYIEPSKAYKSKEGYGKLQAYHNYFIGNDSTKWASFVPLYKEVLVKNVYAGIDVRYYFDKIEPSESSKSSEGMLAALRYDYIVKPGANISQIKMKFDGQDNIFINGEGALVYTTSLGEVRNTKIFAYQKKKDGLHLQDEAHHKQQIACRFIQNTDGTISFSIGEYNKDYALIIDPIVWSTFLGGSGEDAIQQRCIKKDENNNYIVAGQASSTDFPTITGSYDITHNGNYDVFISKINKSGSNLIFSSYIGGNSTGPWGDGANCLAINSGGEIILTGTTASTDFPTVKPIQAFFAGYYDGFVLKMNSSGSTLLFSTYYGGSYHDCFGSLTVDNSDNIYCAGFTTSPDFPTTSGSSDRTFNGGTYYGDVFALKINSNGSSVIYSTYCGGSNEDLATSINVDENFCAYLSGGTRSTDFPTTSGAYQKNNNGGMDGFVIKINASGTSLLYSSYIGGTNDDNAQTSWLLSNNVIFLAGGSSSPNFPTKINSYKPIYGGNQDAFICKMNITGNGPDDLLNSTFFGGSSGGDYCYDIVIDNSNNIIVGGMTSSLDLDLTSNCVQDTYTGSWDGFVSIFSNDLSSLQFSTYLGGSAFESVYSVTFNSGDIIVGGQTASSDYPTTSGVYSRLFNGGISDAFITRISLSASASPQISSIKNKKFGSLLCDFSKLDTIWIKNTGDAELVVSNTTFSGANPDNFSRISPANLPFYVQTKDSLRMIVGFSAVAAGNYTATITLQSNTPDSDSLWTIQLSARKEIIDFWTSITTYDQDSVLKIGNQIWAKCNLDVSYYRNGEPIPQITDNTQWTNLTTGAWCYLGNNPANGNVYGKLYNWYAVNDARGLAPHGWHLPSDDDLTELVNLLGGPSLAGGKLKDIVTGYWQSPNAGATNESGFTALPSGTRLANGVFQGEGKITHLWSSTQFSSTEARLLCILYDSQSVIRGNGNYAIGNSVRCLLDEDYSDTLFLGKICQGESLDTIIQIQNKSSISTTFRSNTVNLPFAIIDVNPFTRRFNINETRDLHLRFLCPDTGTFYQNLIITDTCGYSKTIVLKAIAMQKPLPEIKGNVIVCANNKYFYYTSSKEDIINKWSVFNGTIIGADNLDSVNVFWENSGFGLLKLVKTTAQGCKDSLEIKVTINPSPTIELADIVYICIDSSFTIDPKINTFSNTLTSIQWSPADGLSDTGILNPIVRHSSAGTYHYRIKIIDNNGCENQDSITIVVRPHPQVILSKVFIDFDTLDACQPSKDDSLVITNEGLEDITITEYFGESGLSIVSPALPFILKPGEKTTVIVRYTPAKIGEVTGNLIVAGEPCGWSQTLNCKANKSEMLLSTDLTNIDFGQQLSCVPFEQDTVIALTNKGKSNVTVFLDKIVLNAPFSIEKPRNRQVIKPSETVEIQIKCVLIEPGNYSEDLKIYFETDNCRDTLRVALKAAYVESKMNSTLRNIVFPDILSCDESIDTTIIVHNTGTVDVVIIGVEPQDIFSMSNEKKTIPVADSISLKITFSPDDNGLYNGILIIKYMPCNKADTIAIVGNKKGVLFVNDDILDFGEIIFCNEDTVYTTASFNIENKSSDGIDGTIKSFSVTSPFTTDLKKGDILANGEAKQYQCTLKIDSSMADGEIVGDLEFVISPCDLLKKISLIAKKSSVRLSIDDLLDFCEVETEKHKDTSLIIKNTGSATVHIDSIEGIFPPFELLCSAPDLPAVLAPGEELTVFLRYSPLDSTEDSIKIHTKIVSPCNMQLASILKGRPLSVDKTAKTIVYIQSGKCDVGDDIYLPLMLKSSENLITGNEPRQFEAKIRFNSTILFPLTPNDGGIIVDNDSVITVSGSILSTSGIMKNLLYKAALGNAECCSLVIDTLIWKNYDVITERQNGVFCLTNLCKEGGTRLVSSKEATTLSIYPNPAGNILNIELQTIESGVTSLYISDALGKLRKEVFFNDKPGKYEIEQNLSDLNSGVYMLVLQTPTIRNTKIFVVFK